MQFKLVCHAQNFDDDKKRKYKIADTSSSIADENTAMSVVDGQKVRNWKGCRPCIHFLSLFILSTLVTFFISFQHGGFVPFLLLLCWDVSVWLFGLAMRLSV